MISKEETKLVEAMATRLSRQLRRDTDDVIQAAWLCRMEIQGRWDPNENPDWLKYLAIRIRRATLSHLISTRQIPRPDRGNIGDFTVPWPTGISNSGAVEPMDFPAPSVDFETLDDTLEDIEGLSMRERAVITHRYIRGEPRDSVMKRMHLSSYEMNTLVFSARTKIREALTCN